MTKKKCQCHYKWQSIIPIRTGVVIYRKHKARYNRIGQKNMNILHQKKGRTERKKSTNKPRFPFTPKWEPVIPVLQCRSYSTKNGVKHQNPDIYSSIIPALTNQQQWGGIWSPGLGHFQKTKAHCYRGFSIWSWYQFLMEQITVSWASILIYVSWSRKNNRKYKTPFHNTRIPPKLKADQPRCEQVGTWRVKAASSLKIYLKLRLWQLSVTEDRGDHFLNSLCSRFIFLRTEARVMKL